MNITDFDVGADGFGARIQVMYDFNRKLEFDQAVAALQKLGLSVWQDVDYINHRYCFAVDIVRAEMFALVGDEIRFIEAQAQSKPNDY